MKPPFLSRLIAVITLLCGGLTFNASALTPPVIRSTDYNGAYSNIVYFPVQPWMNTNTTLMTVEAWVSCRDLIGNQAFIARHFTTNFYFGVSGNKLRFYRSGGTSADSDGTLVPNRWTHVAVTYDGTTARFYINGALAGTKGLANAGNNCTNSLSLGGEHDVVSLGDAFAGGYAFNGYLDEVRLWTVVRSQSAIATNMNAELRAGTGLLATFGSGGSVNELRSGTGSTDGIPVSLRRSGFGILPSALCIPFTTAGLRVDGNIDLLNEYRGAETIVLRSSLNGTTPDHAGYLMVSTNSTNFHLYVGIPELQSSGLPQIPVVQIAANVNLNDGTNVALGDWECRLTQDSFQGGTIFGVNPPFFPTPQWLSWGQSALNWQAATVIPFEFDQSYEFRIHGRNLNYFTNAAALLVRYYDFNATEQLIAPRSGITNIPTTYATANWCGAADRDLVNVTISGVVSNVTSHANESGWTVTLRSGLNALGGDVIRTIPVSASGTFTISGEVPQELPFHLILESRSGYTVLPPEFYGPAGDRQPSSIAGNSTLTYSPCGSSCFIRNVRFLAQQPPGPLALTSVTPSSLPATVLLRTSPRKTTPVGNITINGANLHSSVRVYFKGAGCVLDPPSLCTSDWLEADVVSTTFDRASVVAAVPELPGTGVTTRNFQIVVENPLYLSTGGSRWNYGSSVSITPPIWPQLYGFEFANMDGSPSWEEFEACFGDNIFVDVPFTDFAVPGVRDPYYYAFFFPVYMAWMELAQGSCSGFAATSRLMANNVIPSAAFDRADNGEGVHGVILANGYVGLPSWNPNLSCSTCPFVPAAWSGFDLFRPFAPLDVWARITSLQGAQTSAEFLNTWLGQLRRPIPTGPRSGISVGDPNLVLSRVRADARENLIVLGGRNFESLHTITPYGVVDELGLLDDLRTTTPRAGFTLIKAYDNNWPEVERFIEINRAQNTFRYLIGFNREGNPVIVEGAGLYYMPLSVYRNPRHALGPIDIAANLANLLRVLHTGTAATSLQDGAGGVAGWSGTNLVNTYDGAMPFVPPGALPGEPDRFDRTMFFLPTTNPPTAVNFVSAGSDVVLHYGLGGGDFAYGFRAANTAENNSVYGILIGLNQALQGMGIRAGAAVQGFSASVSSRDNNRQSRVWLLDAGAGALTPDLHLERDEFKSLKIRNNSAQPLSYRVNLSGYDHVLGIIEFASDALSQPGNSTVILRSQETGPNRGFVRELDTNNDGTPEATELVPARGVLRASKDSGLLALRWRPLSANDTLEGAKDLNDPNWSPVNTSIITDGPDKVAKVSSSGPHGFFRVLPGISNCFSLAAQPLGAKPNPWEVGGFKFEAFNVAGAMQAQNTIVSRSGATGLDVVHTVRIHPQDDCDILHLDVRQTSGFVVFEAVGPLGAVLVRQELTGAGTGVQRVSLRVARGRIHYVRVISPNALCLIANICCERTQQPSTPPPYSSCQNISNANAGQFTSPYTLGDVLVSATPGPVIIGPVSGLGGNWLKLSGQVEFKFLPPGAPCDRVRMRIRDFEGVVTVKAFDASGGVVGEAGPLPGSATQQELVVNGASITRVVVFSTSDKAFLQSICCERNGTP